MKKRIISLILAVIMIFTAVVSASAFDLIAIFKGVGSVISAGAGGYEFMQLVGIIPPAAETQMLVKINDQLTQVTKQLDDISKDLSDISDKLDKMQANETIKTRLQSAEKYYNSWDAYRNSTMVKLDKASNTYIETVIAKIFDWLGYPEIRGKSTSDYEGGPLSYDLQEIYNDVLIAAFNNEDGKLVPVYIQSNEYQDLIDQAAGKNLDSDAFSCDKIIVLKSDIISKKTKQNVDTYRNTYINAFTNYLNNASAEELKENVVFVKGFDLNNIKADAPMLAEASLNNLIGRLSAVAVFKDGKFARDIFDTYMNMLNNMFVAKSGDAKNPKTGMDAFISAEYLSHVFEDELYCTDDKGERVRSLDIFCDYVLYSLQKYAFFCQDIIGKSNMISSKETEKFLENTEKAAGKIQKIKNSCYTGHNNYCYLTGTVIWYGGLQLKMISKSTTAPSVGLFMDDEDGNLSNSYEESHYPVNFNTANQSWFIGNDAALIITQMLSNEFRAAGGIHPYFTNHGFTAKDSADNTEYKDYGRIIVEKGSRTDMGTSDTVKVKAYTLLGDYYQDGQVYTLKDFPGKATSTYLTNKYKVNGSYLTQNGTLNKNQSLIASAIYGENHSYWWEDESAMLVGPADAPGFTSGFENWIEERGFWYTPYAHNTATVMVKYNMLYQNALTAKENVNHYSLKFLQELNNGPSISGKYIICSAIDESKCLDISGGKNAKSNGSLLNLWSSGSSTSKVFEIIKDEKTNSYIIKADHSGLVLDASATYEGADIHQWEDQGKENQRWVFEDAGNGYVYIRSLQENGYYMDVSGGSTADGTRIIPFHFHGGINQKFKLVKVTDNKIAAIFSQGNIWIIAAVAAVVVIGVTTLIIVKKKKKRKQLRNKL